MKHTDAHAILSDYLDDALDEKTTHALEAHLPGCAECRRKLDALGALLDKSAQLPRSIDPPRDFWPSIEDRLESVPPVRARPRWPFRSTVALAVAASILVLMTVSVTVFLTRERHTYTAVPYMALTQFIETEKHYVAASAELEEAFGLRQQELSSETVALIERNLAVIDAAIREIRDALAEEPNNREVMSMLASAYEKKLSLLRDVSDLNTEL